MMRGSGGCTDAVLFCLAREGDQCAREELVEMHLGLVRSVSGRFFVSPQERADLMQAGMVGLLRAVERFDPERGTAFSTYAVPYVLEEMRRYLQSLGPASVSRRARDLVRRVREHQARAGRGDRTSLCTTAEELGIDAADVAHAEEALRPPEQLQEDEFCTDTDRHADGTEKLDLREALRGLDCRGRRIICRRYFEDMTQQEVAEEMGFSQAQISRLEKKALKQMRDHLRIFST